MKSLVVKMAVIALAAIVCGCERGGGAKVPTEVEVDFAPSINANGEDISDAGNAKFEHWTAVASDQVLMKAGGKSITKGEVEKVVDLRAKVVGLQLPPEQRGAMVNKSAIWPRIVARLPETFGRETAILAWAEEHDISPTDEELAAFRNAFLTGCKAQGRNYDDFMAASFTAEEAATAAERIRIEATCDTAKKAYLAANPIVVSDEEIDKYLGRVNDYNAMATATNALVWANASNVWQRITKEGEYFDALADELSEGDDDEGGACGAVSVPQLEREGENELARLLPTMNAGDITPPIEADNGLCIVRIDEITDERGDALPEGARPFSASYELSRIYFRLPLTYEIPPRDEAAAQIREYLEDEAFKKLTADLAEKLDVEYPIGKTIFINAAQMARLPTMLVQEGVTKESLEKAREMRNEE